MLVGDIVNLLFSQYDVALAEPWDKPGLSVGSPNARVEAIACALDPTPTNIRLAKESGANVLVTHHPAFLEPPFPITPEAGTSSIGGASVYEAARLGVSLIAMHTNLDRSEDALDLIANKLSLGRIGRLQEPDGFGAMLDASSLTLSELADCAGKAFACTPVIWGDPDTPQDRVAFCSGSLGSLGHDAIQKGLSCVIAGEAGYHRLLELSEAGVAAILLGHDASELPFAGLLAKTLSLGAPDTRIITLDESLRWHAWGTGE